MSYLVQCDIALDVEKRKLTAHKLSDTTRASLMVVCWYLSRYPVHADKIRSELQGINPEDTNTILTLPHLNGVINEVLRLVPPAMTGNSRITGPDGLVINDTFIPPFTKVTAPKYAIMRSKIRYQLLHCLFILLSHWNSGIRICFSRRLYSRALVL